MLPVHDMPIQVSAHQGIACMKNVVVKKPPGFGGYTSLKNTVRKTAAKKDDFQLLGRPDAVVHGVTNGGCRKPAALFHGHDPVCNRFAKARQGKIQRFGLFRRYAAFLCMPQLNPETARQTA